MKCSICGFENRKGAKFCGECGKPLITEVSSTLKWGSMIASLVLVLIFWYYCWNSSLYNPYAYYSYATYAYTPLTILLLLGFPTTIILMYKERTAKIKYGYAWILFPIFSFLFASFLQKPPGDIFAVFFIFAIPAIVIDYLYNQKDKKK